MNGITKTIVAVVVGLVAAGKMGWPFPDRARSGLFAFGGSSLYCDR